MPASSGSARQLIQQCARLLFRTFSALLRFVNSLQILNRSSFRSTVAQINPGDIQVSITIPELDCALKPNQCYPRVSFVPPNAPDIVGDRPVPVAVCPFIPPQRLAAVGTNAFPEIIELTNDRKGRNHTRFRRSQEKSKCSSQATSTPVILRSLVERVHFYVAFQLSRRYFLLHLSLVPSKRCGPTLYGVRAFGNAVGQSGGKTSDGAIRMIR